MIESSATRGSERTRRLSETVTTTWPTKGSAGLGVGVGGRAGLAVEPGTSIDEVGARSGAVEDAGDGDGLDEPQPATRTTVSSRAMAGR